MYLRFKTSFLDDRRESRNGVFQAASFLLHNDNMYQHDHEQLAELWRWFRFNLSAPDVYKARKPDTNAICWFKPTADKHIRKMHEMISILEQYDVYVTQIRCRKPGYIIYEDEDQVAVIPFTRLVKSVR